MNSHRRLATSLVLLAIAVRSAAVLILQSHHVPRSTYEHGEIAANLLAGRGFSIRFLGAEGPPRSRRPCIRSWSRPVTRSAASSSRAHC